MVPYLGDYDTTETVYIPFNTFTSDDPSASATITNLAAGDVEIHKDGSTTQRSSDNGVTVTIDFDSVTGNHMVAIDLSDDTDSGFYAAGSRYQVRIEGTTIDGGTVNAWIGTFSIGCVLRPTTAGRKLDVSSGGEAGIDWANVGSPTTTVGLTGTTIATTQKVDVETIKTQTVTCAAGVTVLASVGTAATSTAQTGDCYARLGAPAGASIAADIADIPTVAEFEARTLVASSYFDSTTDTVLLTNGTGAGQIQLVSGQVTVDTNNDKTGYSVTNLTVEAGTTLGSGTHTAQAGDGYSYLETNLGALGANATEAGGTGDHLTAIPKTGYKLATDGLDSVSITAPSGVASNFREMIVQVWRRFFKKSTLTSTQLKTYADDGTTVVTTQVVSDDETTETQGAAS